MRIKLRSATAAMLGVVTALAIARGRESGGRGTGCGCVGFAGGPCREEEGGAQEGCA